MTKNSYILICDDAFENRMILSEIFKNEYKILEAENGKEALDILARKSQEIELILLDLVMPVMSGFEAIEEIKKNEDFAEIPIIVISGAIDREAEIKSLNLGANDFINKPFEPAIVLQRAQNTISRYRLKYTMITNARLEEKNRLVEQHRFEAEHDKLTGLYNLQTFCDVVSDYLKTTNEQHVIIRFEISNFKVINDLFGFDKGDMVLVKLAEIAKSYFVSAILARVYADHFVVCTKQLLINYDEMLNYFVEELNKIHISFDIKILFGIVEVLNIENPIELLCDRTLLAIEKIKNGYTSSYSVYDQKMRTNLMENQWIANNMINALEKCEYEVFFQPQFDSLSGKIVGAEALARWRHPKRGLISPGAFIPIFEQNGFITRLDEYIWDHSAAWLAQHIKENGVENAIPISVNISRTDVLHMDIVSVLKRIIEKHSIPIDLFRLEITESAYAQDYKEIINILEELRQIGFTIEMDDFGSAYSSLNCLRTLPVDYIKLDMKFLSGTDNYGRGGTIVSSVVRMAQWLNIKVIAEGVEKQEHSDFLSSVGCYIIQGYLYSYPLPIPEFNALLKNKGLSKKTHSSTTFFKESEFWNTDAISSVVFNSYVGSAAVFEISKENRVEVLRVNDSFLQMLDISIEDVNLFSINFIELLSSEDVTKFKNAVNEIRGTDKQEICTLHIKRKITNRPDMYIKLTFRQIASLPNRTLFYSLIEDITTQIDLSDQLRADEEKYCLILSELDVATFELNFDFDVATCAFFTQGGLLKYSIDNYFAHFKTASLIHPDDKDMVRAIIEECREEETSGELTLQMNIKNTGFKPKHVKYHSLPDKDGHINRLVACASNIEK